MAAYTAIAGLSIAFFFFYAGLCFTKKDITIIFQVGIWLLVAAGVIEFLTFLIFFQFHFTRTFDYLRRHHEKEYLVARYSHQITDEPNYSYEPQHRKFISCAMAFLVLGFTCAMLGKLLWLYQDTPG